MGSDEEPEARVVIKFSAPGEHLEDDIVCAPIGRFVMKMANLEFALDDFATALDQFDVELRKRISSNIPRQHADRVDFFLRAFDIVPCLQKLKEATALHRISRIGEDLRILFDNRNDVLHGRIFLIDRRNNQLNYRATRNCGNAKKGYSRIEYEFSSNQLDAWGRAAANIEIFLQTAVSCLRGEDVASEIEPVGELGAEVEALIEVLRLSQGA